MEFLYMLEKIRVPGLNELMLLITRLGEETAFLVVAMILFWCVDKRKGYYLMAVGFFGTLTNQFLKITCRVARPWVKDPEFTILEQAREAASGYSFPSGHTQSAVGTFGAIAYTTQKRLVKAVCVAVAALVAFSRMYIGVHFPSDVLVAAGSALLLIVVFRPLVFRHDGKYIPVIFAVGAVLSLGFLAYVECFPFPGDIDPHNMESAIKNAYTLLGALAGLLVAYYVDEKKLHFPVKAVWWAQILKVALGLGLVLLVKEGLRAPLDGIFGGHMIARAVRYFVIVIAAGVVWPMSFSRFAGLGKKKG